MGTNDGDLSSQCRFDNEAVNNMPSCLVKYEFERCKYEIEVHRHWICESSIEFDITERRDAYRNASVHVREPSCNFQIRRDGNRCVIYC